MEFSPLHHYLLILRRDRPLELWEVLPTGIAHLGNVKPFIQMSCIAWRSAPASPAAEEFCVATLDNMLRFFRVEGGKLSIIRQQVKDGLLCRLSPVCALTESVLGVHHAGHHRCHCVAWRFGGGRRRCRRADVL
jgi:hypothetical protein